MPIKRYNKIRRDEITRDRDSRGVSRPLCTMPDLTHPFWNDIWYTCNGQNTWSDFSSGLNYVKFRDYLDVEDLYWDIPKNVIYLYSTSW